MTVPHLPRFGEPAFICPHCHAYASQTWFQVDFESNRGMRVANELRAAQCTHCEHYSLWHFEALIYPEHADLPLPSSDLPEAIQRQYLEARCIAAQSPRSAAAILRVCVHELFAALEPHGQGLDQRATAMIARGLDARIKQALEQLRLTGERAVPPWRIDARDGREDVQRLCGLVNLVAAVSFGQRREMDSLHDGPTPPGG